ncbi:hypothetical protein VN97_g7278 [Penicillium thymicola]|uniref:Uncharacterized protein n=1 Tax=Penicillium thymicola TaxID=293382 RepID=A0AAI9TG06_PENTH|nr:hypothetical protein VN97_g7278 [Penicillium thymicola]
MINPIFWKLDNALANFYGFNAIINVANASTAALDHINVTVPNSAPSIYAYGTDTTGTTANSCLYFSGPTSNGPYESGNGIITTHNVTLNSGSKRSSSFLRDSPKGDIYVYDSVIHSVDIGSATYYALETIEADNFLSDSGYGPVVF